MNKPYLIVLKGHAGSGKTETFKELYKELEKDQRYGHYWLSPYRSEPVETKALVYIKGLIIGVFSAGDIVKDVKLNIERFLKLRCAIIVCACHPENSPTYDIVESFRAVCSDIYYVDKLKANGNYGDENIKSAKEVKEKMEKTIEKISKS